MWGVREREALTVDFKFFWPEQLEALVFGIQYIFVKLINVYLF